MTGRVQPQGAWQALSEALHFLMRVPLPTAKPDPDAPPHSWTMSLFPLVGLLLGLAAWILSGVIGWIFPQNMVDLVILGVLAVVTGAIHWDGLMNMADAMKVPLAERMDVMRSMHVGSFGLLILVFVAGMQWGSLSTLGDWRHGAALVLFPVWGRWAMVAVTLRMGDMRCGDPYAPGFLCHLEIRHLGWATAIAVVCSVLVMGLYAALALLAVVGGVALALRGFYRRAFGGISDDLLGASCCVAEAAALATLAALA